MKQSQSQVFPELSWTPLESVHEIESWMDLYDRELQAAIGSAHTIGHGICFRFLHGGQLHLHTNPDGDVLLDLSPEAAWIAPVITAVTKVEAPRGQYWMLPGHTLLQLIMGLNTLIGSSQLVLRHEYKRPA